MVLERANKKGFGEGLDRRRRIWSSWDIRDSVVWGASSGSDYLYYKLRRNRLPPATGNCRLNRYTEVMFCMAVKVLAHYFRPNCHAVACANPFCVHTATELHSSALQDTTCI